MSQRIHIRPDYGNAPDSKGDGGIRRVVEAQRRHLPAFGWEIVDTPEAADVIAMHATNWWDRARPEQVLVSHCHGLYWSDYEWTHKWYYEMNVEVINCLRRADLVTAPSEWVAQAIRRGMSIPAVAILHGIEPDDFPPRTNDTTPVVPHEIGYALWNKTRVDPICTPEPLIQLASLAPDVRFMTTFSGELPSDTPNIAVSGRLGYEAGLDLVRGAGVYLCTTRETMGIGTLEAMAAGVPILGWAWGGQREIVRHRETGWLSVPGDYDDLLEGLRFCLERRQQMGKAARDYVMEFHPWSKVMAQYHALYSSAIRSPGALSQLPNAAISPNHPRVSIIVTCYDLERYLKECIESVIAQPMGDWELIVVDDCSPGDTPAVLAEFSADPRIRYVRNEHNLYLAGALNVGVRAAQAQYILPLDADNMLGDNALGLLANALDNDRSLDIVYGAMHWFVERSDGTLEDKGRSPWPFQQFKFNEQIIGHNQIPSTSMYRKKIWERIGGYRERCRTAEDADFWGRATSFGAQPARVTDATTLVYRDRDDSMSRTVPLWKWWAWYPWSADLSLVPFGAAVDNQMRDTAHNVSTFEPVQVSVVIPVGVGHEHLVKDAVDSLVAQTFQKWECIVVNDTGNDLPWIHPFVRVLNTPHAASGPAVARNIGIKASVGRAFFLLDADDFLAPMGLEHLYGVWREQYASKGKQGYVYSDWIEWREPDKGFPQKSLNYDPFKLFEQMPHSVSVLCDKTAWEACGGFDEQIVAWEDWDFFIALASVGVCGLRVTEPLLNYRLRTGTRRELMHTNQETNKAVIYAKWAEYIDGGKQLMACGGCGGGPGFVPVFTQPPPIMGGEAQLSKTSGDFILLEFAQEGKGAATYVGPATQTQYRFGSDDGFRVKYVHKSDAEYLLRLSEFRVKDVGDTPSPEFERLEAAGAPSR